MKVLIIGGFLGSGKTTFILHLARYLTKGNQNHDAVKVVIVENEIGDTAIDQTALKNLNLQVKNLFSGCACCTLAGETADAMLAIREQINPEWVLLEATGVAIPDNIRHMLDQMDIPSSVCVIADSQRWNRIRIPLRHILKPQIESADNICLSKADTVSDAELRQTELDISLLNLKASVSILPPPDTIDETIYQTILG